MNSALPAVCLHVSPETVEWVESFSGNLTRHGLNLVRGKTHTLQVNVGFLCDLLCRHCPSKPVRSDGR